MEPDSKKAASDSGFFLPEKTVHTPSPMRYYAHTNNARSREMTDKHIQAFPVPASDYSGMVKGMSLRDYFAGQSLIGWRDTSGTFEKDAAAAYAMADTMLLERAK